VNDLSNIVSATLPPAGPDVRRSPRSRVGRQCRGASLREVQLAAASWDLEALDPDSVILDLSGRLGAVNHAGSDRLRLILASAGIPLLLPHREGGVQIDARAFLEGGADGEAATGAAATGAAAAKAAAYLGLALFVVSGVRARALDCGNGACQGLSLEVGVHGLSLRQSWFLADRLAWLQANAILIGSHRNGSRGGRPAPRTGGRSPNWLCRLAGAFAAEYGEAV
jgi:hypothetical protein